MVVNKKAKNMIYLIAITFIALLVSFIKDKNKTIDALKLALKKLMNISTSFLLVFISVSIVFYYIPESTVSKYLVNSNKLLSMTVASLLGSITIMPGFIAFPLSGILRQNGVPYMVISAFTSTLMMVGILTFPIEKKYFGLKVAILRNILSLVIAIIVSVATGIFYGELF